MESRVVYVIKVLGAKFRRRDPRDGWISAFGYTTSKNIGCARRFTDHDTAESFALLLAAKIPEYIGTLRVASVVHDSVAKVWRVKA